MRVAHYILGFPPMRSGGLTRYALDLMQAQRELGHEVTAIYPGNFSFFSCSSSLKRKKDGSYVLRNALPVSLMYGVSRPSALCAERKINGFEEFMTSVNPEVLHVHTLMGLPKEILLKFREAGVRVVYTTHDYFGLCPKVNLVDADGNPCTGAAPLKCELCCRRSRGLGFLWLRNSPAIVPLKKFFR